MKSTEYKLFIEDILESIEKIQRYIKNLDYEKFKDNELVADAVIRNLEIIGEASKNIPDNIRAKYPNVPWRRMIGLRNITAHEYFGVDLNIIWEIITANLSETKPKIELMLED